MAFLHYYIHGRGHGHATRSLPIISALRKAGHQVRSFAGEDAVPLMTAESEPITSLRPCHGAHLLPLFIRRVSQAIRRIRRDGTRLVVSDGDLPGILAANLTGRPSVTVGHSEIFSHCRRPAGVPRWPWLREGLRAWVSSPSASRYVAVSFLPLEARSRRVVVAGPVVERPLSGAVTSRVVCYFRDENGSAPLQTLVDLGESPVVFTQRETPEIPSGVEIRPFDRKDFLIHLSSARAVVASAGSQLMSECLALGIPLFALHADHDDEQRLNVALLRASQLGDGTSFNHFSPTKFRTFLERRYHTPLNPETGDGAGERAVTAVKSHPDAATAVVEQVKILLERHS